jgi:predicted DNA-binding transcriptional regulator AlpA
MGVKTDTLQSSLFISRENLAARWAVTKQTLKRKEQLGLLQPVVLGPRLLRYKLSEIEAIENSATLNRRQEEVRA